MNVNKPQDISKILTYLMCLQFFRRITNFTANCCKFCVANVKTSLNIISAVSLFFIPVIPVQKAGKEMEVI